MKELSNLGLRSGKSFATKRGRTINAAQRFAVALLSGAEVALPFETAKQRIKRAGADAVAVAREFFHHAEAEDGLLDGVMEDVEADQAGIEVAIVNC